MTFYAQKYLEGLLFTCKLPCLQTFEPIVHIVQSNREISDIYLLRFWRIMNFLVLLDVGVCCCLQTCHSNVKLYLVEFGPIYESICGGNFSFYCIVKEFVGVCMYIVYKHLKA